MAAYSKKELLRVLHRNLQAEFRAIEKYLAILPELNYAKNKRVLRLLIFDSFKHASMITEEIIALEQGDGKLSAKAKRAAMVEETSLKEIYAYELMRTQDPKAAALLHDLIREEEKHQKLVELLK